MNADAPPCLPRFWPRGMAPRNAPENQIVPLAGAPATRWRRRRWRPGRCCRISTKNGRTRFVIAFHPLVYIILPSNNLSSPKKNAPAKRHMGRVVLFAGVIRQRLLLRRQTQY